MPREEERQRGGVKRYRTINPKPGRYIHVGVVPKAGPRGGHTVAGPVHKTKKAKVKGAAKGMVVDPITGVGPKRHTGPVAPSRDVQVVRTTRQTITGKK